MKVQPWDTLLLEINDVVLVRVKGKIYLHKIVAIKDNRFLIGNNKGGLNGWTGGNNIAGKCVSINGVEQ